jgi:outer membrane protein, adhesin transport system
MHRMIKGLLLSTVAFTSLLAGALPASALSLREAVRVAIESNPEIGQAAENREAVEFELRQALGLYMPRVDLEASVGAQLLDSPGRRAAGIEHEPLYPSQVGLTASYDIFDGGYRQSEANRQAARVDGASFRVLERSEFIALQIARLYFEIVLQQRIIDLSRQNVAFHQTTLDNVIQAVSSGQLTEADRQQAQERLAAAKARVAEAREQYNAATIEFYKYVGLPFEDPKVPSRVGADLPSSLDEAIAAGRINNPRVLLAGADIDAAAAVVEQSKSGLLPKLTLEAGANTGLDVGGVEGRTSEVQARLVFRMNIFDGGIKNAEVQENMRRESEAMLGLSQVHREVEEAVRMSWNRMHSQTELAAAYAAQLDASVSLVSSYQEQFGVGQRSLLDVLDAQNTRYNLQVLNETAQFTIRFAEYRLMAASGLLLKFMGLKAPNESDAYARELLDTPSYQDAQPRELRPVELSSPFDLTRFVN